MMWNSNAAVGCTNTLFTDSHSELQGGAVSQYIYNNVSLDLTIHLLTFCFFNNNSANSNPGNDVYFHGWKPTQPFLHCFSTTKDERICYYSGGVYYTDKDDWLPQAHISEYLTVSRSRHNRYGIA